MRWEVRVTGLGGQGAITIGHLLGRAAVLYEGREATVTEGYSPYITGGWARTDVVISDAPIDFPLVSKLDMLVTMYQEGLVVNLNLVKPNGLVLAEKKLVDATRVKEKRKTITVPAAATAEGLGRKILTNVVLLGSLGALSPIVSMDSLKRAVRDRFPKHAELNTMALDAGFDLAKNAIKEQEEVQLV